MATPNTPRDLLEQRYAVYLKCVSEGFAKHDDKKKIGKPTAIAEASRRLGISRECISIAIYRILNNDPGEESYKWTYPVEIPLNLHNATVMIAGDLHMWPLLRAPLSPIKSAFRQVAKEINPTAIIFNGDMIDGTRVSRHPPIRGQNPPKVSEEIQSVSDYLLSLPETEHRIITMSNHDVRIDNYIAMQAGEMQDLCPRLIDRLPGWQMAYAAVINDDVEIRHETGAGGIHVRHNNATRMGRTIVTGHTHQLGVTPVYTRRGTHYGIECGMLSHPYEPQFEYTWNRPTRWQPGFVVLTFDADGILMPPETCEWINGRAIFRGAVIESEQRYRVRAGSNAV